MTRKNKNSDEQRQQLTLFNLEEYANSNTSDDDANDDFDEDWMSGDDSDFEMSDRFIETPTELLTFELLRTAIEEENSGDKIMQDFCEYVLPNLLRVAIGVTAKGGNFFERLYRQQGKENVRRDNAGDQSLNSHIINGLLPANLIERRLHKLDVTVKKIVKETERRLLIAGFVLHDFEKFDYRLFPEMPEKYREVCQDPEQDICKLSQSAHQEIIDIIVRELNLDKFISPNHPVEWQDYREDLLFIIYNTQVKNGTNLNLSVHGLQVKKSDRLLICLSELTRLADLLASVIKHPQDAEHQTLNGILHKLSDGQLKLTYHSIAENRGVLTNVVNNALMDAYQSLNTENREYYKPLLYLPTGVVYLAERNAPPISTENLPNRVVDKIKKLCAEQLQERQTGFGRDGKGIKYADYYEQFFDDVGLMRVALNATLRILNDNKSSVAKSRSDNLQKFQSQGVLSQGYDFQFEDDIRCDRLAEFGDVISRKIWGERLKKTESVRKELKKKHKRQPLPELPDLDVVEEVAKFWQLEEYLPQIREIQTINDKLKELKLKGNTGGVPYEWYFLAAKYLQHHPGTDDVKEVGEAVINYLAPQITSIISQYELPDGWDDLRLWVQRVVMLPSQKDASPANVFLDELNAYQLAKKLGRGRQLICSISHSAYTVTEQMESAVLFTPQVYTNKQMLGGSNAKRNISSIAGVEMMLRQILMNPTQAVGKRFEDGKYRYLYFYPTYYCTPETNKFLQRAYSNITQTRFTTSLRNHFINDEMKADLSRENYQQVDAFLINAKDSPGVDSQTESGNDGGQKDRTFKLSYPEEQPLTFYFMALPPGREPSDTESWIMPSWLGFAFPIVLDVKTAVSESPIPPFKDGTEFEESMFLDSAPQAFRALLKGDRFRLDSILEDWEGGNKKYSAPLNVLTAAYAIHLDVNAKQSKGKYDASWGKFSELATDFETSPLNVFSYLKRWARRQGVENPRIEKIKLYAYQFYPCFDAAVNYNFEKEEWNVPEESPLHHPKQLTELYRQFYRANKRYNPKTNAVLKPMDIAAKTILEADPSYQHEVLVDTVAAEVCKLMDRVHASTAEGRWVTNKREEERQKVLQFASYFVEEVFYGTFAGDRAQLAGRPINLIKDTCEFIYRLAVNKDNLESDQFDSDFDATVNYNFEKEEWNVPEESPLHHPKQLTELYRQFYRANKRYNPKTNAVLKPMDIAAKTILEADPSYQHEVLVDTVAAEVCKLMDRVHASTAEGRWVTNKREEERQKVLQFASYFVEEVFYGTFAGDRARLAGRQINLIKDTCEFLYRLADDKENAARNNQSTEGE